MSKLNNKKIKNKTQQEEIPYEDEIVDIDIIEKT
jgi:hypothetical protein